MEIESLQGVIFSNRACSGCQGLQSGITGPVVPTGPFMKAQGCREKGDPAGRATQGRLSCFGPCGVS